MKRGLILILTLIFGCRTADQSNLEYDDLYFTSKDRLESARQRAPEAKVVDATPDSTRKSDVYIQGEEKKQTPASTGQSDTYIYNFDSRTFEKVNPKTNASTDSTGGNGQKNQINNSNQNVPSGSGVKTDSLGK